VIRIEDTIIIEGKVVSGRGRGKKLGFPTANIDMAHDIISLIKPGVYASLVRINKEVYQALTSVGASPTYDSKIAKVEPHIFDFNKDIYGCIIVVSLIKHIRYIIKFNNGQELAEQFKLDCVKIRRFFY
jgi:riboflavin kinase/FMN adenylyltransferase